MAKRNKARFASKSRKSALRVEALEQRQLLATVTGGGTEVGANIQHPNGNVYDQVLMTGSAVNVTADAGQVTRVSFLDLSGDIVQAEFAGAGNLTISLDGFVSAKAPTEYNQPGVQYVSGNATFTIQGSDANTNFSVFSVGPLNAVNQALFEGGKDGGNNLADVQAVVIVNNPLNPGGFSNFGGIRAGNAVFAGSAGNVGITAVGVSVQGPVIIGDINASDVGVPVLNFGGGSQFNTLTVAGGDLIQTNGALILGGLPAIQTINFTAGANSKGDILRAQVNPNVGVGAGIFVGAVEPTVATLDAATSFDITGKTQGQIDDLFLGRSFTNAITVKGELAVNQTIKAATFRKGVTFENDIFGDVSATIGDLGAVTVKGDLEGDLSAFGGVIGNLTVEGNLVGMVGAKSIGDVVVKGNLSGSLTTDVVVANNLFDTGEGRIGNVSVQTNVDEDGKTVGGSITGDGAIEGVLGIGNVSVAVDITSDGGAYLGVFTTHGTGTGDAFLANIGTLTVEGDVDQGKTSAPLIRITGNGTFGNVLVKGASASKDDPTQIGAIIIGGHVGSEAAKTGTVTITEMDEDVEWGGMIINGDFGTIGAVTITGDSDTDFLLTSPNLGGGLNGVDIDGTDMSVKGLTITGFKTITTSAGDPDGADDATGTTATDADNITAATIDMHKGPLTLTTANVDGATITINGTIGVVDGRDTGAIVLNAGTAAGNKVDLNAAIGADDLAAVTITGTAIELTGSGQINADNSAKDIILNGNVTMDGGAFNIKKRKTTTNVTVNGTTAISGTQTFGNISGALTLNGDVTFGKAAGQFWFQGDVGSIVINGDLDMSARTNVTPAFLLDNETDDNGSANDVLGSLTINGQVKGVAGVTDIRASKIGNITIKGALTQDQVLVENLDILAAPNGDNTTDGSEKVNRDGSNLSDYSIGNITIQSVLDLAYTGTVLFKGDNTFAALGLGDINITGATSGAQQSRLFAAPAVVGGAATDSAWFAAGDVDGLLNTTANMPAGEANVFLYDFDSDGDTDDRSNVGTAVPAVAPGTTTVDYTGGTFAVGNVTVNALQTTAGLGISGVDDIAGNDGGAGGSAEGFAVLAGVKQILATGDLITYGAAASAVNAVDIDADVKGTIGNILIASFNAVGFVEGITLATLAGPAGDTASAILAASSVGTVQGTTPTTLASTAVGATPGLNETGDAAIIGDSDATKDGMVDGVAGDNDDASENQIVVLVV